MMLGYIGIVCTSTVKHVYNKVQGIHYISTVIHYVRQASIHYKCVWYNCVLLYYIEDAADLNRQWFTILSHFTSLQRISFTEQILKIDNNTSEFCKQILICLRWFICEITCIVYIGSTLVQRVKNWSLFRKFVHITYQISGIYPNFRSYVI